MITEEELVIGIEKCIQNAESLIEDATLLKQNQRKERAYALFQLASEEIGKASRTLSFLLSDDITNQKSLQSFSKDFRNHKLKTAKSISFDYFVLLALKDIIKDPKEFLMASISELQKIDAINDLKNFSLYTSLINEKFITPNAIISKNHLDDLEFRVLTRLKVAKPFLTICAKNFYSVRKCLADNSLNEEYIIEEAQKELLDIIYK